MEAERRRDYPDILGKLEKLENYQSELKTTQEVLKVLQQKDLDVAEDWRRTFCGKLDKLIDTINNLPCDLRDGRWKTHAEQIRWLWIAITFVSGIFLSVIAYFSRFIRL